MKRALWITLALIAATSTYAVLRRESSTQVKGSPGAADGMPTHVDAPLTSPTDIDDPASESPVLLPTAASDGRVPVHEAVLDGQIIDATGVPVTGARISWSPLPDGRILGALEWHEIDWAEAERASKWATSDEQGHFSFDDAPEPDVIYGSVIWATHPEWEAVSAVLEPEHAGRTLVPLETSRSGRRTVRVVDGSSQAVAGATVWQFAAGTAASTDEELARRAFFRRAVTDEHGEVPAFSLGATEVLIAETESAKSEPRVGPSRGDVRLTLRPTFTAHGSIVLADGAMLEPWPRVTYGAVRDGELEALGTRAHESGAWGPVEIPLVDADAYRFQLHGGGLVAVEQELAAPQAGQLVRVDFETIQGVDLWFLAKNREGEVLLNASAEVTWVGTSEWPPLPSPPARKDGYVYLRGAPPGTVNCVVSAPGYAPARFGPNLIPEPEPATWEVVLDRAGGVSGRCLFEGAPVSDFEISSCPPGAGHYRLLHEFEGRADGSFEIPTLEEGEQVLIAFADELGQSDPVHVRIVPGETRRADLELSAPISGTGRVVDGLTGRPLADVDVQRVVIYDKDAVGTVGAAVQTDVEGLFTLEGLGPSGSGILLAASGYSTRTCHAPAGDPVDFGTVELMPAQRAEFVLPASVNPRGFSILSSLSGPRYPFSNTGSAVIEDFEAGRHTFRVLYPDDSQLEFFYTMKPGEEWLVPVPVAAGDRHLRVTVKAPHGESLPPDVWLLVDFIGADGSEVRRKRHVPDESPLEFDALPASELEVTVSDSRDRILAYAETSLADQPEASLQFELGRDEHRIRVLDADGAPVESARVDIRAEGREYVHFYGPTDATGEFVIHGLPEGTLLVGVAHERAGVLCTPLDFDEDGNMTLVLDDLQELAVQLVDDGPLVDKTCSLYSTRVRFSAGGAATDETGTARWSGLGPGNYLVEFRGTGYWPVSEQVSTPQTGVRQIAVRRLGDIELEVRNAAGVLVSGVALDIRSLEFDRFIASWAEEGKVELPEGGLYTDGHGRLRLDGLPHGEYSWASSAPDAGSGRFEVPAGMVGEAVLRLP